MWTILEFILVAGLILISITEFFYPILAQKPLFGSFRKSKPSTNNEGSDTLDDKISAAKTKAQEIKKVQDEVAENLKKATDLKNESQNLFN